MSCHLSLSNQKKLCFSSLSRLRFPPTRWFRDLKKKRSTLRQNLKMASAQTKTIFSEDEFGRKLDRCVTDTLIKGAGGLFLGSVFSILFFKRRRFPIVLGTGFGIGVAYRNCEEDLNK